jgi:hypothetical protein
MDELAAESVPKHKMSNAPCAERFSWKGGDLKLEAEATGEQNHHFSKIKRIQTRK